MRLPRLRTTVRPAATALHTTRRLMALVAVVAIVLGGRAAIERRRVRFTNLYLYHQQRSEGLREVPQGFDGVFPFRPKYRDLQGRLVVGGRGSRLDWHRMMRDKYQDAIGYPWLPVPPDPPPPE